VTWRTVKIIIKKKYQRAGCRWLTLAILASQEAEIRRITVQSQPQGKQFVRPYLEKTHHKNELVEWLKVKAEFKPQYHTHTHTKKNHRKWRGTYLKNIPRFD
jgi:hypothetical protein